MFRRCVHTNNRAHTQCKLYFKPCARLSLSLLYHIIISQNICPVQILQRITSCRQCDTYYIVLYIFYNNVHRLVSLSLQSFVRVYRVQVPKSKILLNTFDIRCWVSKKCATRFICDRGAETILYAKCT